MRVLKKIHSLIAGDILSLTFIIIAALTSVMFIFRVLGYAEYIFSSKDSLAVVIMMVVFLIPGIFKITVPIALLLGSTITGVRMSHDRELEAWMASGVSIYRMCVMPAVIGIVFTIVALISSMYMEPLARREWLKFRYMHARSSVETIIESRLQPKAFISDLFNTGETAVSLYFDSIDATKHEMSGVFIAFRDKKANHTSFLVGSSGTLRKVTRGGIADYVFTLHSGRFYQPERGDVLLYPELLKKFPDRLDVTHLNKENLNALQNDPTAFPPPDPWTMIEFGELEVSLLNMFEKNFAPREFDENDIRSMNPPEYYAALKEIRKKPDWKKEARFVRDHTYFYEQFVTAFACLFLPTIGLCLGLMDPRRKGGIAYFGMAMVTFIYYAFIMLCQNIAHRKGIPTEVMLVLPTLSLAVATWVCLRWRAHHPPSVRFFESLVLDFSKKRRKQRKEDKA